MEDEYYFEVDYKPPYKEESVKCIGRYLNGTPYVICNGRLARALPEVQFLETYEIGRGLYKRLYIFCENGSPDYNINGYHRKDNIILYKGVPKIDIEEGNTFGDSTLDPLLVNYLILMFTLGKRKGYRINSLAQRHKIPLDCEVVGVEDLSPGDLIYPCKKYFPKEFRNKKGELDFLEVNSWRLYNDRDSSQGAILYLFNRTPEAIFVSKGKKFFRKKEKGVAHVEREKALEEERRIERAKDEALAMTFQSIVKELQKFTPVSSLVIKQSLKIIFLDHKLGGLKIEVEHKANSIIIRKSESMVILLSCLWENRLVTFDGVMALVELLRQVIRCF